jgi:CxxC motif-containing protein (DUF1111 family)
MSFSPSMKSSFFVHYSKATVLTIISLFVVVVACRQPVEFEDSELDERLSGGDATVFDEGSGAFGHAFAGMSVRDEQVHGIGDKFFEALYVSAPAPLFAGLGPVYNSRSCVSCHIGDGRGTPPPDNNSPFQGMLFKLATGNNDAHGAPEGVDGFGGQLQDKAIAGAKPEGSVNVVYTYEDVTLQGGEKAQLRKPDYTLTNLYKTMGGNVQLSPRVANPVFGVGLLETIADESILQHADPNDADNDGISGKVNYVYNYVTKTPRAIGKFGLKGGSPDAKTQVAKALNQDMGLTTSVFPQKSAKGQEQMTWAFMQQPFDIHDTVLQALTFYVKTLAVPARRNTTDPVVKAGQQIFRNLNCIGCHVDKHITNTDVSFKLLSGQLIRPYTDLLLHDMGAGLADGYSEFDATGNEWKTPALWGLGLTQRVSGHTHLLHDGRARNITEAILWHGGEAEKSKKQFVQLSTADREALLKFLNSL